MCWFVVVVVNDSKAKDVFISCTYYGMKFYAHV